MSGISDFANDYLIVLLAITKGLVTQQQLEEAVSIRLRSPSSPRLIDIAYDLAQIPPADRYDLCLTAQGLLFGNIAIRQGFISEAQLNEALAIQDRSAPKPTVGKVLVELGHLDSMELKKLLHDQEHQLNLALLSSPLRQNRSNLKRLLQRRKALLKQDNASSTRVGLVAAAGFAAVCLVAWMTASPPSPQKNQHDISLEKADSLLEWNTQLSNDSIIPHEQNPNPAAIRLSWTAKTETLSDSHTPAALDTHTTTAAISSPDVLLVASNAPLQAKGTTLPDAQDNPNEADGESRITNNASVSTDPASTSHESYAVTPRQTNASVPARMPSPSPVRPASIASKQASLPAETTPPSVISKLISEDTTRCLAQSGLLIRQERYREAIPFLLNAKRSMGCDRDPRLDILLARVELAAKRPGKAYELLMPHLAPTKSAACVESSIAWATEECVLLAGFIQMDSGHLYDAASLFDQLAAYARGFHLVLAAEGCGKALMMLKEHRKAVEALEYAWNYARVNHYERRQLIQRLGELLTKARRLADIDLYGEDFVLYREAETLRRESGLHSKALPIYEDVIRRFAEGPYANASILHSAICRSQIGQIEEARKTLLSFCASNPDGLYSGESLLELGKIELHITHNFKVARNYLLRLNSWLVESKERPPLAVRLAPLESARSLTTPPQLKWCIDKWGNKRRTEIRPGQLVNSQTCPWYLDDLTEQCTLYLCFFSFCDGNQNGAMDWLNNVLALDPATRNTDTQADWNSYRRMKWGVEHGYLYAYPQELASQRDPSRKLAILLIDFYYVTERFADAAALAKGMLDGKWGRLSDREREYPQFVLAASTFWLHGRDKAIPEYLKVLGERNGPWTTYTQFRSAYCVANLAWDSPLPVLRKRAVDLFNSLIVSPEQNEQTWKAPRV